MGCGASTSKAQDYKVENGTVHQARPAATKRTSALVKEQLDTTLHFTFLQAIESPKTDLKAYVEVLIAEVLRLLDADRCSIFFVNDTRQEVWCVGAKDMKPFCMPMSQGIVGAVAREGKLLNLRDAHDHESFDRTIETKTGYIVRSMICLPIGNPHHTEASCVGILQVLNKQGGGGDSAIFTERDEKLLLAIGEASSLSFYKQRWRALRSGAAFEDEEVQTMLFEYLGQQQGSSEADEIENGPPSVVVRAKTADVEAPWLSPSLLDGVESAAEVEALVTLNFDVLQHSAEELLKLAPLVLQHSGSVDTCGVRKKTLFRWCEAVHKGYRDNPYHNWFHAFSVFHQCYFQLMTENTNAVLRCLDVLALLTACLCHDLDHCGRTNNFLIDNEDDLAIRYNDRSVLENHHASMACQLLKDSTTDIAAGLATTSRKMFRKGIISSILATDMLHHSAICDSLASFKSQSSFNEACGNDRQLLMSACIHTCDIAGQALPWEQAQAWESRICQEFVSQAQEEEQLGRTPAPFMNFKLEDSQTRAKLQRDFIDFVLVPLFEPYTQLLPGLQVYFDNLIANRERYEANRRLTDASKE